jgi:hypothetical protein
MVRAKYAGDLEELAELSIKASTIVPNVITRTTTVYAHEAAAVKALLARMRELIDSLDREGRSRRRGGSEDGD